MNTSTNPAPCSPLAGREAVAKPPSTKVQTAAAVRRIWLNVPAPDDWEAIATAIMYWRAAWQREARAKALEEAACVCDVKEQKKMTNEHDDRAALDPYCYGSYGTGYNQGVIAASRQLCVELRALAQGAPPI